MLLVFALMLRLLGGFRIPLLVAALWAVHPVLTESVTNIVGRADLLAGMAVLGGFLIYLKSVEAIGRRRIGWLVGLACTTAAGVFSKESAVILPGVIVLYEFACHYAELRQRLRALLWGCTAMILPICLMLWQRSVVLAASPKAEFPFVDNPIAGANFWIGRLTAIKVLARYFWLTIWPWKLSRGLFVFRDRARSRQLPGLDCLDCRCCGPLPDWICIPPQPDDFFLRVFRSS